MSKLLWAGMAGFLCGMKYKEMKKAVCWKRLKRQAVQWRKRLG